MEFIFLEKRRPIQNGKRVPLIQKVGRIKVPTGTPGKFKTEQIEISKTLFASMMQGWLLTKNFCDTYLRARSASMAEAFNSAGDKMGLF